MTNTRILAHQSPRGKNNSGGICISNSRKKYNVWNTIEFPTRSAQTQVLLNPSKKLKPAFYRSNSPSYQHNRLTSPRLTDSNSLHFSDGFKILDITAILSPMALLSIPVFLFGLSVHEMAHALTANWGGDDTAYHQGRITLNPISHIDPIGTILIPLLAMVMGGIPLIGWAEARRSQSTSFQTFTLASLRCNCRSHLKCTSSISCRPFTLYYL